MLLFKICDGYVAMLYSDPFQHAAVRCTKIQVIMPKVAVKNLNFSPKLHCMYAHLYVLLECSQLTLKLKISTRQIEPCQIILLIQF